MSWKYKTFRSGRTYLNLVCTVLQIQTLIFQYFEDCVINWVLFEIGFCPIISHLWNFYVLKKSHWTFLSFSKVKICFPNGMILIFEGIVLKHENIDCLDPLKQFWKLLRLSLLASLYHEFWVFSYTDASNQNRRLLRKPYWNRGTLSQDYIC